MIHMIGNSLKRDDKILLSNIQHHWNNFTYSFEILNIFSDKLINNISYVICKFKYEIRILIFLILIFFLLYVNYQTI